MLRRILFWALLAIPLNDERVVANKFELSVEVLERVPVDKGGYLIFELVPTTKVKRYVTSTDGRQAEVSVGVYRRAVVGEPLALSVGAWR